MQHVGFGIDPNRAVQQIFVLALGNLVEDITISAIQGLFADEPEIIVSGRDVGGGVVLYRFGFPVEHLANDPLTERGRAGRWLNHIIFGIGRYEGHRSHNARFWLLLLFSEKPVFPSHLVWTKANPVFSASRF